MSTKKEPKKRTTETIGVIDRPTGTGEMVTGITGQAARVQTAHSESAFTDTQLTALDLYERGFNVIPLIRYQKEPFVLRPLYAARLHHCTPACTHRGKDSIEHMFRRKNIGVVVGRTSGNLVDIDCETQAAFEKMGAELTRRNIPFWAFRSSDGGHYLVRVLEGEIAENKPRYRSGIPDVEIWGTRHYVVIPPSIHPNGTVYTWVTPEPRFSLPRGETIPAVSIKELEWLGIGIRKEWQDPELFGLPEWAASLSFQNRKTLAAKKLPEGSRNRRLYNALADMHGNKIPYEEARKVAIQFAKNNHIESDKSLREYIDEVLATLKSAYSNPREPARKSKDEDYIKEWEKAKLVEKSFDWNGVFGRRALTRRAAYNALIERARMEGRPFFRASVREVAEIGGMNKETAMDALHDLRRVRLIQWMDVEGTLAGVYSFNWEVNEFRTVKQPGSNSVRNNVVLPKTQAEKDVARNLGMAAWYVWKYLLEHPAKKPREIADALNLKISSVRRALKILSQEKLGMVIRDGRVYSAEPKTDASLAEMAIYWFNGASPSLIRKETHRLERELRNNKLVRRAIAWWEVRHGS